MKCDICGSEENVSCEVMMKGDAVERVYTLCGEHWVEVYRRCLDEFMEENEYKVNAFIKAATDRLIVDSYTREKTDFLINDEGLVDFTGMEISEIRNLCDSDEE